MPPSGPSYGYQQHSQPPPYGEERRPSAPPIYSTHPPSQSIVVTSRPESSPQPGHQPLPPHHTLPHISPPPPHLQRRMQEAPPALMEPKTEQIERPLQPSLLNTASAIKKLPQRKSHSIFTPIEENRSILSQHLASFASDPQGPKLDSSPGTVGRSMSYEAAHAARNGSSASPLSTTALTTWFS